MTKDHAHSLHEPNAAGRTVLHFFSRLRVISVFAEGSVQFIVFKNSKYQIGSKSSTR